MTELYQFPGYLIYEDGYVSKDGRILPAHFSRKGYLLVNLSVNKKNEVHKLHRLIALALIPNPDNLPCVDHINRDRTDNSIENLRWVTWAQNAQNRKEQSDNKSGYKHIYQTKDKFWGVDITINGVHEIHSAYKTLAQAIKVRDDFLRDGTRPNPAEMNLGVTKQRHITIEQNKYRVRIKKNNLGYFGSLEEAIAARDAFLATLE